MPENRITVVARLISKPDKIDETRQALIGLIEPTREEKGCVFYDLIQNNLDETDFTFIEEWTCDDALDAHLQTRHLLDLQSKEAELLAAPPDIRRYSRIA